MSIFCFSPFGYEGSLVSVEVDLRRGIPAVDLVGLADGAVKESRERMKAAIKNSGYEFPPERVLISLSPADLKKEGAGFDLAMALAVLSAKEDYPRSQDAKVLVMGELELSGKVRAVKGVTAALSTAYNAGITYAIIPSTTEAVSPSKSMKILRVDSLEDAYNDLVRIDEYEVYGGEFESSVEPKEKENGIVFMVCIECGCVFERTGRAQKYCKVCAEKRVREKNRKYTLNKYHAEHPVRRKWNRSKYNERFSGLDYKKSPEELLVIKKKYENGVSLEDIQEMVNNLIK